MQSDSPTSRVQSLRRTEDDRRVEQAFLDIGRALSVLRAVYDVKPEAFQSVGLKTNAGEPVVAYNAVAFLERGLKELRWNMERDYREKLNTLYRR